MKATKAPSINILICVSRGTIYFVLITEGATAATIKMKIYFSADHVHMTKGGEIRAVLDNSIANCSFTL